MKTQRLILDTSYILPLFGIKIKSLTKINEGLKLIWKEGIDDFEVYLPSICLIESLYKLIHEYKKNNDYKILKRYPLTIPTITTSQNVKIFNSYIDSTASQIAIKIRHAGHSDMMDCWIAASAAALNGILLTEDPLLKDILKRVSETKFLSIWSWKELIDVIL